MSDHRTRFLQLALDADALRFGEFTLKSGRVSPYFFNAGRFDRGASIAALAGCYADAIEASGLDFDLLFGPAYKGIPLATARVFAGQRGGQRDALVGRPEQQVERQPGGVDGIGIAGGQRGEAGAVVEAAGVEEVRRDPAGLEGELAEAQGLGVQG